jgi:hypothetical protein
MAFGTLNFSANRLDCIPPGPHCVRILLWNARASWQVARVEGLDPVGATQRLTLFTRLAGLYVPLSAKASDFPSGRIVIVKMRIAQTTDTFIPVVPR